MSWDGYITTLMAPDTSGDFFVIDAAIVGIDYGDVWGAYGDGQLKNITKEEVKVLVSQERGGMMTGGVTLAGARYTVLRDNLFMTGDSTLNIKSKNPPSEPPPPTYNVTIQKTLKSLVIVKGSATCPGGKLRERANTTASYLVDQRY